MNLTHQQLEQIKGVLFESKEWDLLNAVQTEMTSINERDYQGYVRVRKLVSPRSLEWIDERIEQGLV